MGRPKKVKRCRKCGARGVEISQKGLCYKCSEDAIIESIRQLRQKTGPMYEKWREGLKKFSQKEVILYAEEAERGA